MVHDMLPVQCEKDIEMTVLRTENLYYGHQQILKLHLKTTKVLPNPKPVAYVCPSMGLWLGYDTVESACQ